MRKKSGIYKRNGRCFRYDYEYGMVTLMIKATKEDREDNRRWQEKFGRDLWHISEDGYIEMESVGLCRENWKNREARDEYLDGWMQDMKEETDILAEQFRMWG